MTDDEGLRRSWSATFRAIAATTALAVGLTLTAPAAAGAVSVAPVGPVQVAEIPDQTSDVPVNVEGAGAPGAEAQVVGSPAFLDVRPSTSPRIPQRSPRPNQRPSWSRRLSRLPQSRRLSNLPSWSLLPQNRLRWSRPRSSPPVVEPAPVEAAAPAPEAAAPAEAAPADPAAEAAASEVAAPPAPAPWILVDVGERGIPRLQRRRHGDLRGTDPVPRRDLGDPRHRAPAATTRSRSTSTGPTPASRSGSTGQPDSTRSSPGALRAASPRARSTDRPGPSSSAGRPSSTRASSRIRTRAAEATRPSTSAPPTTTQCSRWTPATAHCSGCAASVGSFEQTSFTAPTAAGQTLSISGGGGNDKLTIQGTINLGIAAFLAAFERIIVDGATITAGSIGAHARADHDRHATRTRRCTIRDFTVTHCARRHDRDRRARSSTAARSRAGDIADGRSERVVPDASLRSRTPSRHSKATVDGATARPAHGHRRRRVARRRPRRSAPSRSTSSTATRRSSTLRQRSPWATLPSVDLERQDVARLHIDRHRRRERRVGCGQGRRRRTDAGTTSTRAMRRRDRHRRPRRRSVSWHGPAQVVAAGILDDARRPTPRRLRHRATRRMRRAAPASRSSTYSRRPMPRSTRPRRPRTTAARSTSWPRRPTVTATSNAGKGGAAEQQQAAPTTRTGPRGRPRPTTRRGGNTPASPVALVAGALSLGILTRRPRRLVGAKVTTTGAQNGLGDGEEHRDLAGDGGTTEAAGGNGFGVGIGVGIIIVDLLTHAFVAGADARSPAPRHQHRGVRPRQPVRVVVHRHGDLGQEGYGGTVATAGSLAVNKITAAHHRRPAGHGQLRRQRCDAEGAAATGAPRRPPRSRPRRADNGSAVGIGASVALSLITQRDLRRRGAPRRHRPASTPCSSTPSATTTPPPRPSAARPEAPRHRSPVSAASRSTTCAAARRVLARPDPRGRAARSRARGPAAKATTKADGATHDRCRRRALATTISFALTSADHVADADDRPRRHRRRRVSMTADGTSITATSAEASAQGAPGRRRVRSKDSTGKDANRSPTPSSARRRRARRAARAAASTHAGREERGRHVRHRRRRDRLQHRQLGDQGDARATAARSSPRATAASSPRTRRMPRPPRRAPRRTRAPSASAPRSPSTRCSSSTRPASASGPRVQAGALTISATMKTATPTRTTSRRPPKRARPNTSGTLGVAGAFALNLVDEDHAAHPRQRADPGPHPGAGPRPGRRDRRRRRGEHHRRLEEHRQGVGEGYPVRRRRRSDSALAIALNLVTHRRLRGHRTGGRPDPRTPADRSRSTDHHRDARRDTHDRGRGRRQVGHRHDRPRRRHHPRHHPHQRLPRRRHRSAHRVEHHRLRDADRHRQDHSQGLHRRRLHRRHRHLARPRRPRRHRRRLRAARAASTSPAPCRSRRTSASTSRRSPKPRPRAPTPSEGSDGGGKDVNQKADANLGKANDSKQPTDGGGSTSTSTTPEGRDGQTNGGNSALVSIAGAIAINVVSGTVRAWFADGITVDAGGLVTLEARGDTDSLGRSRAATPPPTGSVGVGAGVAVQAVDDHGPGDDRRHRPSPRRGSSSPPACSAATPTTSSGAGTRHDAWEIVESGEQLPGPSKDDLVLRQDQRDGDDAGGDDGLYKFDGSRLGRSTPTSASRARSTRCPASPSDGDWYFLLTTEKDGHPAGSVWKRDGGDWVFVTKFTVDAEGRAPEGRDRRGHLVPASPSRRLERRRLLQAQRSARSGSCRARPTLGSGDVLPASPADRPALPALRARDHDDRPRRGEQVRQRRRRRRARDQRARQHHGGAWSPPEPSSRSRSAASAITGHSNERDVATATEPAEVGSATGVGASFVLQVIDGSDVRAEIENGAAVTGGAGLTVERDRLPRHGHEGRGRHCGRHGGHACRRARRERRRRRHGPHRHLRHPATSAPARSSVTATHALWVKTEGKADAAGKSTAVGANVVDQRHRRMGHARRDRPQRAGHGRRGRSPSPRPHRGEVGREREGRRGAAASRRPEVDGAGQRQHNPNTQGTKDQTASDADLERRDERVERRATARTTRSPVSPGSRARGEQHDRRRGSGRRELARRDLHRAHRRERAGHRHDRRGRRAARFPAAAPTPSAIGLGDRPRERRHPRRRHHRPQRSGCRQPRRRSAPARTSPGRPGVTVAAALPDGARNDFIVWSFAAGGGKSTSVAGSAAVQILLLTTEASHRRGCRHRRPGRRHHRHAVPGRRPAEPRDLGGAFHRLRLRDRRRVPRELPRSEHAGVGRLDRGHPDVARRERRARRDGQEHARAARPRRARAGEGQDRLADAHERRHRGRGELGRGRRHGRLRRQHPQLLDSRVARRRRARQPGRGRRRLRPGRHRPREDDIEIVDVGGTLALSKDSAGVGITVVVEVSNSDVRAWIGDAAAVRAGGSVLVEAVSAEDWFVLAVAGAASAGSVAATGSVLVVVSNQGGSSPQTLAEIGDALVEALDDLTVHAQKSTSADLASGNLSVSTSGAGVGASVAVVVRDNHVTARIDDGADVRARDDLTVEAEQTGEYLLLAVGGAGGTVGRCRRFGHGHGARRHHDGRDRRQRARELRRRLVHQLLADHDAERRRPGIRRGRPPRARRRPRGRRDGGRRCRRRRAGGHEDDGGLDRGVDHRAGRRRHRRRGLLARRHQVDLGRRRWRRNGRRERQRRRCPSSRSRRPRRRRSRPTSARAAT